MYGLANINFVIMHNQISLNDRWEFIQPSYRQLWLVTD